MSYDTEQLQRFPTSAGVYLMKNAHGTVLYVGKAKNLKQRIRQYFFKSGDKREMIPFLIAQVVTIETIVVASEKEALLLESHLIKTHKPKYNALFKDDKSYIALKLTRHSWPRIDVVRYRGKPKADGLYYGPYTSSGAARQTLDLLQKLFPMRQCSDAEFLRRTRPCILYDMGRCIAPCVGKCSNEEYQMLVNRVKKFLQGRDKEVLKELYQERDLHAERLEYEKAATIQKTIQHIERTIEKQSVDKPLGGDCDVIGIFRQGDELLLVVLLIRSGTLSGTKHYNLSQVLEDDKDLLVRFLLQHYMEEEWIPHEVLVPEELEEAHNLEELISVNKARTLSIRHPKRGEKATLLATAKANAEAIYLREKDAKTIKERTLMQLREMCRLNHYPARIECVDVSHLSGKETVATIVAFTDGAKDSKRYKKYRIKSADQGDDYGAVREVLRRRLKKGEENTDLPDLLIIDGGKGHLNVALQVVKELDIVSLDLMAVAKEEGRHDRGITSEQIFLPGIKDPLLLKRHSPLLFLLQQIRDEAHRFSITYQKKARSQALIHSALDEVQGIGPVKKKRLLRHFGSLKAILLASAEELSVVKGISQKDIEAILRTRGV